MPSRSRVARDEHSEAFDADVPVQGALDTKAILAAFVFPFGIVRIGTPNGHVELALCETKAHIAEYRDASAIIGSEEVTDHKQSQAAGSEDSSQMVRLKSLRALG